MPVVFAKKARSINLDGDQYATTIYSFTKQREYPVIVGRRFLSAGGGYHVESLARVAGMDAERGTIEFV